MPTNADETLINKGKESLKNAPNGIAAHAPKGRISDAALRALKPADKPYKRSVGEGLYLEVMPGGSKLWRWKYRIEGKENRYSLGCYPELSLREAREAVEAARKLVKQGLHPAQQKKLERIKATHDQAGTLEAITKEWLALKDWEEITKKRRENMLTRVVFPALGQLPIRQITSPMILDVLKRTETNNGLTVRDEAKRTLFGIFEFALEMERVEVNPVRQWKTALPKNKTQHKRALDKTEIGKLM